MSYIGNTPTTQSFISGTDYFNGTGAQTAFTLSRTVASVNDIQAVVNNVVQVPNDAYTISGTTITFTSAPSAGTQNVYVRYLSTTTQAITPSQNTVSWSTLDSNVQGDLGISFKNRIINSNMAIDQRNAGAATTINSGSAWVYTLDRWSALGESALAVYTVQQSSNAPAGFTNSLLVTVTTSASVSSGNIYAIRQPIEGFNVADLNWGTANAKTITLSFWVRSSLTGTFGGALGNSAGNRSYPFSYTISSANTWEQKSITITGDITGTWLTTNGTGIFVYYGLGVGSTYTGTAGAWVGALDFSATGAVDVVATNGATFQFTGVQLEVGTQATTFTTAGGSYGAELALCQRYYYQIVRGAGQLLGLVAFWTATDPRCVIKFPVSMRTTPSVISTSGSGYYDLYRNGGSASTNGPFANSGAITTEMASIFDTSSASTGTAGQAGWLQTANASAAISFSAEL